MVTSSRRIVCRIRRKLVSFFSGQIIADLLRNYYRVTDQKRLKRFYKVKVKVAAPYSITERMVPELILVSGSQPAGDVSHKPGGRLPLLSARLAVTPATHKRAFVNFDAWCTDARWVCSA